MAADQRVPDGETAGTSPDVEMATPKRRLHLTLDLHADDLKALVRALEGIASDLFIEGRTERETTSGGSTDGYHLTLTDEGEHVTHDSYVEALNAWLEARRG